MAKRWYTLAVQTEPVDGLADVALEAVAAALGADRSVAGPVVGASTISGTLSARLSVEAPSIEAALAAAAAAVRRALRKAKLGDVAISDADVALELPGDEFASARDDLVGTPDVAQRLGISRQRVAQLVEQPGRFPAPVARVRGTHIWRWGDIVDWISAGKRDMRRKPTPAEAPVPKRAKRKRAA